MKLLKQYISDTIGVELEIEPIPKQKLGSLPIYITEIYKLYELHLLNQELVLAEPKDKDHFSIMQTEINFIHIKKLLSKNVILYLPQITAFMRKRLIEKGINFIVPGKQLFVPDMLLDLRESFTTNRTKPKNLKLLPSAQFILIYHIIHRYEPWQLENHSFKEIAEKLGYTAMAITKAIENLKYHELIDVKGEKEKFIKFRLDRGELWRDAEQQDLLVNPVLKRVYVDEKPEDVLLSNASALPEYTDMNPSRQEFYAIEKNAFYALQKNKVLINANEHEGKYCLEVWKYNPENLVGEMPNDSPVVDPLSLYLSLKDSHDERIEMALEQILDHVLW